MTDHRKRYDRTFKAKVVLESLKNQKTIAELASEYGIHPNQITQWRKQALEDLPGIFSSKQAKKEKAYEEEKAELYRQIGQLKVEVEWLKKKVGGSSLRKKRESIDMNAPIVSISRQCELINLSRSSLYYQSAPVCALNLRLMHLIDRQYTKMPYYGAPRMTTWLKNQGYQVNHKHIARLMSIMGI